MWPFTRVQKPSPKRLAQLEAELGDVQIQCDWIRKQVKDLNSRLSTVQRQQKPPEDAPEETNGEREVPQYLPFQPRPVESTAHLARRFRGT